MIPETQRQTAQTETELPSQSVLDTVLLTTSKVVGNKRRAADMLGISEKSLFDYLRNCWPQGKNPPLTDAECYMGVSLMARYELDPATKEIYVVRMSRGLSVIIGLDGWIKVLERTDGYDGFDQNETFDEKGELTRIETVIYSRKRSHPTKYRAYMTEYRRVSGDVAVKMPWHMLGVFSLRHAARLFTSIGGNVMLAEEAQAIERAGNAEQRSTTLKEKVAAAGREFEPIAQPEPESARTEVTATSTAVSPPSPVPARDTVAVARNSPEYKEYVKHQMDLHEGEVPPVTIYSREPGDDSEHEEAVQEQTVKDDVGTVDELAIVNQYKAKIAACTSLKDANTLVTMSTNDPLIRRCSIDCVKYLGELISGNVTAWKQKKASEKAQKTMM